MIIYHISFLIYHLKYKYSYNKYTIVSYSIDVDFDQGIFW